MAIAKRAQGAQSALTMAFEQDFGTTPSTGGVVMPIISSSLKASQNLNDSAVIRGTRNPAAPSRGNIDCSGSVVPPIDVIGFGYWLKLAFGDPVTSVQGSGHKHVFKIGPDMPSATFEQGYKDISTYQQFSGVRMNKMSLNFGGDSELTASIDVMGCKETMAAVPFDTAPKSITFTPFENLEATIKEGGVTVANVLSMSLDIDFGLDGDSYAIGGKGFRTYIDTGIIGASGTIKAFFQNMDLLNKAVNGTKSSLELTLTKGTNSLTIKLPELIYERNSPGIDGPKGVNIELPFKAYYTDSAEKSAVVFELVNSQASY
ncbi:phage tail tube protein [Veillonella caviae]|uniref:phage tail tube protein n=1 Tax=Veillonella caviae TaxID=248316 RepID=UPI0023F7AFE0|nr:phage tail tube protein [Veillonella caviae]